MNQETRQETNKPENSKKPEKDTALRDHIKARITRKPNRIIKRSFIESAMCNHNIVMLLMGMLVFLGILGICIMPKQEMPQFTIRQGACVAVYPGATSREVEERVAKPLENFIFGYKEVNKKKTYTQSKDGMLIVFLEPGKPIAPIPVLLRIEFTASDTLEPTGALLPHLSILT